VERIYLDYRRIRPREGKLTLLLGSFDGVHRGHRRLIEEGKKAAEGDLGVLLFAENPAAFLPNGKSHEVLTSLEDKLRLFEAEGLDCAFILKVDRAFFDLSPEAFLERVLKPLHPESVVVGEDYTFGRGGSGRADLLSGSFVVAEVPLLDYQGAKVSTQRIIADLTNGDIASANRQLGRDYEIHGTVGHGFENGRRIGFPTANLETKTPYALPKVGVYGGLVFLRGLPYRSLINIGTNPTVGLLRRPRVECYLKGFEGSIYGETIYVSFHERIRDEIKFASLSDLERQLKKDIASLG
jgi:riboflavin kinase/FMN adenylyltransferase